MKFNKRYIPRLILVIMLTVPLAVQAALPEVVERAVGLNGLGVFADRSSPGC